MKNKIKLHSKFEDNIRRKNINSVIITFVFLFMTLIFMLLIVTTNINGFNDAKLLWKINRKLLVIIPLGAFGIGISSFLLQQMSKNKLADTSILGIGNANLIFVMILIYNLDFGSERDIIIYKSTYPIMFLVISVFIALVIYILTSRSNKSISKKFIITGIILNFAFIAISYSLNNLMPSNKSVIIKDFSVGFIDNVDNYTLLFSSSIFLMAFVWLVFLYQKFNICCTNEYISKQLGINSKNIFLQILIICGMFVASSYIVMGNVTFLGMISANVAFSIFKKNKAYSLINAGMISTLIISVIFFINTNIISSSVNTTLLVSIASIPYFLYIIIAE